MRVSRCGSYVISRRLSNNCFTYLIMTFTVHQVTLPLHQRPYYRDHLKILTKACPQVDPLTIWDKPMTLRKTCESSFNSNKRPFYQEDFRKNEDVDSTSGDTTSYVKRSITLENKEKIPTFFGKESIIEKR